MALTIFKPGDKVLTMSSTAAHRVGVVAPDLLGQVKDLMPQDFTVVSCRENHATVEDAYGNNWSMDLSNLYPA